MHVKSRPMRYNTGGVLISFFFLSLYLLLQLQELTYLELADIWLRGPGGATPVLQPLEALTRLVDLRIAADAEPGGDGVSGNQT
jgi:hypothetical protein